MMEEVNEVDLCVICCSKIKSETDHHLDNINSQLLSSNLIIFYLLRRVLQVNDNELKKNLISCGNPVEWIRLCEKCTELSRQAEKLHRKLRRIERELSCIQQLIWDKARLSINSEDDRQLVGETIDLTKKSGQVWRRIRNHVANKCNSRKSCTEKEKLIDPFTRGDELANYLITQKVSTAILPIEHSEHYRNEEDDIINLEEETNVEATSSSSPPLKIKIEVSPELPFEDKVLVQKRLVDNDKVEEENVNLNWEPDDEDDDNDESEEEQKEDDGDVDEDAPEMNLPTFSGKGVSTGKILKRKKEREISKVKEKVDRPPQTSQKRRRKLAPEKYRKMERTEDGKYKCRYCHLTFAGATGCNGHEREKHPKIPGAFPCSICGRAFNSRDYLGKHKKRSHQLNSDGTFQREKNPKIISTPDGKYECPQCDRIFSNSSSCGSHQREKHSRTPGAFICDICGRAFNSVSYLHSHKISTHRLKVDGTPVPRKAPNLERDHICDQCGNGFTSRNQFKNHVRFVHEKGFSIKCTLCGMGWPSNNVLKKHLLAKHPEDHSTKQLIEQEGLGIWKCPVIGCTVRFLKESRLKAHLTSIHGKDKGEVEGLKLGGVVALNDPDLLATCPTCGKVFPSKQSLKKHEKEVHGNEGKAKEFFCEICGGGFVSRAYLNRHVKRVHLKKPIIVKQFN